MARNLANPLHILCLSFFLLAYSCNAKTKIVRSSSLHGMFTFGSSVVDNGNTAFGGRIPPYGVDFPCGPNGRPTNGKNVADQIADHLNLPSLKIPSFFNTEFRNDVSIIHGVNFGYSGSGILNGTGQTSTSSVVSLSEQITNFETVTLPKLEGNLRSPRIKMLREFLFMIAAGNNDCMAYILGNNFLTPDQFADLLIAEYSAHLKRLYKLGARNFLLLSAYPLKCSPRFNEGKLCKEDQSDISTLFYKKLVSMVDNIKRELTGAKFVAVNAVKIFTDVINNADSNGFSNVIGPCCELDQGNIGCSLMGARAVCKNRTDYAYFDGLHTTEALSDILATKAYTSKDISEVYPYNLKKLIHGL